MKNFRSSKNLKSLDPMPKQQCNLRLKVKALQQQVQLLQKSNLNIFIPLSEHKQTINYDAIIKQLKTQILSLQQQIQRLKANCKKIESQKEMQKMHMTQQIAAINEQLQQTIQKNTQLRQQIEEMQQSYDELKQKFRGKQKQAIQLGVQNRFLKEDVSNLQKRCQQYQKKHQKLHSTVMAVHFNSRIFRSRQTSITAIQTIQLQNLKNYILDLQQKIKQMLAANKQERVSLGLRKSDLGQQIVRLKKNIDLQLGLSSQGQTTASFLKAYKNTQQTFKDLLSSCKP